MGRAALIAPRLLTRDQAADYCGVSVPTFAAICPIHPIAMGNGKRMERFDVQALDDWINGLRGQAPQADVDWLERL